tara:strand:- start:117 stop:314 length:198 start_codon:yes stop_codon:yes gene_type:complete
LLGFDDETNLCEQFGVSVKEPMYVNNFMGIQRSIYLIDIKNKFINIWLNLKVDGHAQDDLSFIKY